MQCQEQQGRGFSTLFSIPLGHLCMSPHLRTGRGTETPDPATQATARRLQSSGSSCTTGFQLRLFLSDHVLQRWKVPDLSVMRALSPCPHPGRGSAGWLVTANSNWLHWAVGQLAMKVHGEPCTPSQKKARPAHERQHELLAKCTSEDVQKLVKWASEDT